MKPAIFLVLLTLTGSLFFIGVAPSPKEVALVEAVQQFLETLDDAQLQQLSFELDDDERYNWHYTPRDRKGLPLKAMGEDQQQAAMHLLELLLSEQGLTKAKNVMALENVLRYVENRPDDDTYRDPENYYFTIFGNPQPGEAWGWRLEGHHLSLNFSSLSNEIVSATPTFFGANPGKVPSGPKEGWRVLQPEEDLGRELVKLLDSDQLKTALIAEEAYPEIVTGTERQAQVDAPTGIAYRDMTTEQQSILMQLIELYYNVHRTEVADAALQNVKDSGLDEIHFGWAGGLEIGDPHYYRIQNEGFVIEYDNTQNNANHIHTIVRDLQNDWGDNTLKTHYEEAHK